MFWPELATADEDDKPQSAARVIKRAAVLDPAAVGCDVCPLKSTWRIIASPKMPISGNARGGDVLILAEAPGETEDQRGEALVGASGKLIRELIPRRDHERLAFQNMVRCRPDSNRTPTTIETHCCSVHLDTDIAAMPKLKAILGLGAIPLRRFFPGASIMRVHGLRFPINVNGRMLWYYPVMHPSFVLHTEDRNSRYESPGLPVMRADVKRFFQGIDKWEDPAVIDLSPAEVILPTSREEAQHYIDQMQGPIAADVETLKLRPYERNAELLTGALSDGSTTIAFPCNHPLAPTSWGTDLLMNTICDRRWIAHNAAMEMSWFRYYNKTGKQIAPYDDSMALVRLAHERESVIDLGDSSHIQLGVNVKRLVEVDASRIIQYPLEQVLPYNGLDAVASALIYRKLIDKVNPENYQRIIGSIDATTTMELEGLPVDEDAAQELRDHWLERQQHIREEAAKLYEVRQYEAERGIEFKLTSPEQVGTALVAYGKIQLPMTGGGKTGKKQYSTDEQVLSKYADTSPLARAALDDREATKIISTYIEPTLEVPKRYPDGRLHPTYTTMLVSTQRLSSRDPNIQNYPVRKHKEIRRQIVAMAKSSGIDERKLVMCKFDYGQLEARVLAMASKDHNLCQSIIDHFDIHSYWLDQVLQIFPDYIDRLAAETGQTIEAKIRKAGRDIIKSDFVFSSLYGSNADTCSERTKIPLHIVQELLAFFWETYRGVKRWHKDRRNEYRDTGAITTLTKRVRRGMMTGNEPINTPIQGTAADIVIDAMNEMAHEARSTGDMYLHPRINIHDDLSFFLPEDNLEPYIDFIHPILTKVRFPWQCVPLTCELAVGDNWAELEQIATFEGKYVH